MPIFTFAAAKDGDVMLANVKADDLDVAPAIALPTAGEYHGFNVAAHPDDHHDGVPHADWFGGFPIKLSNDLTFFRSEEHTPELKSTLPNSSAFFCSTTKQ